jgi:NitT/TauT family transport system substrate-binding protein
MVVDTFRRKLILSALCLPFIGIQGCTQTQPVIRVGGIKWIGYEPLFLARELNYYDPSRLHLVEFPSNTANLMALASGEVDAATLTLDECLIALADGMDVRVILIFDESAGADVILAQPSIKTLAGLRGKRIGVEETAAGALMLSKLLEIAELKPDNITKVHITGDQHIEAYKAHEVDALVSYEPYSTRLESMGARRLLDSSRFPGLIVDVLVVKTDALNKNPESIKLLLSGYFQAIDFLQKSPAEGAQLIAPRLGISPAEVTQAFKGVHMMDLNSNHAWLDGSIPHFGEAARNVANIMRQNELLLTLPNIDHLQDARLLPETTFNKLNK